MKTNLAITLIAIAILSLQPFVAAKSSSSNPQSVLDPLSIQEAMPKKPARIKRVKAPKRKIAQLSNKQQNLNLDETFDREVATPKSLSLYQKATSWHKKVTRTQSGTQISTRQAGTTSKRKSILSWNSAPKARQNPQAKYKPNKPPHSIKNIHSKYTKNGSATSVPHKNIFQNSADTAGKMFTAPFNKMRSVFGSKQKQN